MSAARVDALLLSLVLAVPLLLIPFLELNATHLFHPAWPGHARVHHAWQLLTHGLLALLALDLAWRQRRPLPAALITLCLFGGFLLAWGLQPLYGGSMQGTTSAAASGSGPDLALLVMGSGFLLAAVVAGRAARRPPG
ncbi:MAG TPA: hypothetical protein VFV27_02625 [Nevskiaceae bacterium]|nr:hypothetical protein [Nevskiaceae bacterium]